MPAAQAAQPALWPLAVYFAAVVFLASSMIGLSYLLGEKRRDRSNQEPYESGIKTTGSARQRMSAKFYVVAMMFVIFDLESVFIFAWAVAVREVGWAGYAEVLVFIGVLVATLVYLWRLGALDWGTVRRLSWQMRQVRSGSWVTPLEAEPEPKLERIANQ